MSESDDHAGARMQFAYTPEELTILAPAFGADEFPGVLDPYADADAEMRERIEVSVLRGLYARGVITAPEDDVYDLAMPHRAILTVAMEPEILVTVESTVGVVVERFLFHADPELAVKQETGDVGLQLMTIFDTTQLPLMVVEALGASATISFAEPSTLPTSVERTLTVEVAWRDNDGINERTLAIVDAGDEGMWLVSSDDKSIGTPVGSSQLLDAVIALMPAGS